MNKEYKTYLDNLRDSGVINMFGAGEYLMVDFDLDKYEANKILLEWMQTFKEEEI